MGIANTESALERLRKFRSLITTDQNNRQKSHPRTTLRRAQEMLPLIRRIAERVDPASMDLLSEERNSEWGWRWDSAVLAVNQLIGILDQQDDYERILGPAGPTLAANRLHPWVWEAAASLWDGGHYDSAVHAAYKAVERQTQVSISRLDLDGKALYGQAFSVKDPKPGEQRLRFPDINRTEEPKRWTSAHEGAQNLGMGCAQGIRNPQAHPSPDLTEQEALEQLAALSVLARWVDECEAVSVDEGAAGE